MSTTFFSSVEEFKQYLNSVPAVLVYFSTASCNVGEALEPKVKKLITEKYPNIVFQTIDLNFSPEIAANFNAFIEPTILVFFEGKESIRKSRVISVTELDHTIGRLYTLIFEE